ncbi:MAG: histidine--tRNA ligase [Verrucomicrobia bacterium]|nr:histidine--tRNA ligase [Verrucomicrobiota bacterium]
MAIPSAKGVFDILPHAQEDWRDSGLWAYLEGVIRTLAERYCFGEIRTPLFERTELFNRGVGTTSDIVSKEMYTFEDRAGRSMSLRPEGTAPVARAYIEHHLEQSGTLQKLFYISSMFRYERQQAGRYRQHHQFGAEIIGGAAAGLDAELIDLLWTLLMTLGLKGLTLHLNSLGDVQARQLFRTHLQDYLRPHLKELSSDSQERFAANPLRILDSKAPQDRAILQEAPSILDFLQPECAEHFSQVQMSLKTLNIPFVINPQLVRGLDYYNRTVFEITANELGAQNSLGGGGRYDSLMQELGGPDVPALGFGAGLERILQTMIAQKAFFPPPPHPKLLLIPLGAEATAMCMALAKDLRQKFPVEIDHSGKKLKASLKMADALGAEFVAVIGENEMKTGVCEVKQMATHTSRTLKLEELDHV